MICSSKITKVIGNLCGLDLVKALANAISNYSFLIFYVLYIKKDIAESEQRLSKKLDILRDIVFSRIRFDS